MKIKLLSVRFADDGDVTIDWMDTAQSSKDGGTIHSTYVTMEGQGAEHVEYWLRELMQDVDELLGHARKLVE
jgi:hypothetical protein